MMICFDGENGMILIESTCIVGAAQVKLPTAYPTNVWVDFEPGFVCVKNGFNDVLQMIAAATPIAQPAQPAQPVQPASPMWYPTEAAITALKRFEETCCDAEGYDVPKGTMRNLAAIGLIYRTYGDMYLITDFGNSVLASAIAQPVQPAQEAEHPCSDHPDAPHGFNRNASHNAGRYVCDCEGWAPAARVPLTDANIRSIWMTTDTGEDDDDVMSFARAIESHHGITGDGT